LNLKTRKSEGGGCAALLEEADAQVQEVLRLLQGSWATFANDLQTVEANATSGLEAKH
jgi:hypothetical protein